jgi:hypothetical protein
MEPNWAAEHLQVIRTLMERSALYRRALAPIMIFNGALGALAAIAGIIFHVNSARWFIGYWLVAAFMGCTGSFLLVRRQALKDVEPFWSPPTRRVVQAVVPPMLFGCVLGLVLLMRSRSANAADLAAALPWSELSVHQSLSLRWLPLVWVGLYGCALHGAGFFVPRGMKLFGWALVLGSSAFCLSGLPELIDGHLFGHGIMGLFFGVAHLACGGYLYFTESRGNES